MFSFHLTLLRPAAGFSFFCPQSVCSEQNPWLCGQCSSIQIRCTLDGQVVQHHGHSLVPKNDIFLVPADFHPQLGKHGILRTHFLLNLAELDPRLRFLKMMLLINHWVLGSLTMCVIHWNALWTQEVHSRALEPSEVARTLPGKHNEIKNMAQKARFHLKYSNVQMVSAILCSSLVARCIWWGKAAQLPFFSIQKLMGKVPPKKSKVFFQPSKSHLPDVSDVSACQSLIFVSEANLCMSKARSRDANKWLCQLSTTKC